MLRLPRIFRGPWAAVAVGSLALLSVVCLANATRALPDWLCGMKDRAPEPVDWVAQGDQYPPALLRLPGRIAPARLDFAKPVHEERATLATRVVAHPAGFTESADETAGQTRSVLRRLPKIEVPQAVESSLPRDEWHDERLPELNDLDPPADAEFGFAPRVPDDWGIRRAPTATESYPGAGGGFEVQSTPPSVSREETSSLPPTGENPSETVSSPRRVEPNLVPVPLSQGARKSRATSSALQTVSAKAHELERRALSLAERGAFYSAKAEFIQALRLLTQALDGEGSEMRHSRALAAGLKAIAEADDFVPRGAKLEADLDVTAIVTAHQTPVLKNSAGRSTPLAAVQRYYTYAQEQLVMAGGDQPAASAALYGLGRIHLALAKESVDARRLSGPKAMTFHQAALLVDANNHRAANELGVLLAKYGQLDDAKRVLLVGLSARRAREAWHNLAVVHERLGETDLARRARHEAKLSSGPAAAPASDALVRWVSPREFSAGVRGAEGFAPAASTPVPVAPKTAQKKTSGISWPWK